MHFLSLKKIYYHVDVLSTNGFIYDLLWFLYDLLSFLNRMPSTAFRKRFFWAKFSSFCSYSLKWLQDCRKTFCESLTTGKTKPRGKGLFWFSFNDKMVRQNNMRSNIFSLTVLKLLLEKVCTAMTNIPEEAIFPLIDFSGIVSKK